MFTNSNRFTLTSLPVASLLLAGLTALATASTVPFESSADLDSYSLFRSNAPDPAIEVVGGVGAGLPATGGLRVTGSSSAKRIGLLLLPEITDSGNKTRWTTSLLIAPREVDDISSGEKNAQVRLGFAASRNTSNIEKFFNESNQAISLVLKAQHKVGDATKQRLLEFEGSSRTGSEVKFGKVTVNNAAFFDEWLRATLTLVRTGADTFSVTYKIESLGPDGTGTPTLRAQHTEPLVTNTSLATTATLSAGFSSHTEKASNNRIYFDDHTVALEAIAPDAATANVATSVGSSAAIANWTPPASGVPPTGYVLEVTTAADNFAPNTFLAADGTPGQSGGIAISGGAVSSQTLTGLLAGTGYVYRIRATNAAGPSANSNVIAFTTESEVLNAPPTLDPIPNQPPIPANAGPQTITLSGIGMGFGDTGQTLTVTAVSSDPGVVPHPTIIYSSPDASGLLTYLPAGVEGQAVITVTVDDGQPANNTISRQFTVTIRNPPELFSFDDAGEFSDEFTSNAANANFGIVAGGGVGNPAGGALSYRSANSSDNAGLFLRMQPFQGPQPSSMKTSLLINLREMDDHTSGKHKAEVRLGFSNEAAPVPSDRKKFFEEGGATRRAAQVRLSAEHQPGTTDRLIKIRASSHISSNKTESGEITLSGQADLFDHWLKLEMEILPTSTSALHISYRLFDMGPFGDEASPVVVASGTLHATNPGFLAASWYYPGFILTTEKGQTTKGIYVDDHRAEVLRQPPATPSALPATRVTSQNLLANWQPGSGAVPLQYVVELCEESATFAPGSLIAADGTGGQTSGVPVNSAEARSLQFTGLNPSTAYKYRVIGVNGIGSSAPSAPVAVTTLSAGVNVPPGLDPMDSLLLAADALEQEIPLTGIHDGGELDQFLTVSAESSNPALIPHPVVDYSSPDAAGVLRLAPTDLATGSAEITVTVSDGAPSNSTFQRTFTVQVVEPEPLIAFDTDEALSGMSPLTQGGSLTRNASTGEVDFQATGSGEAVAAAFRPERFDPRASGWFETSMLVNFSGIASATTQGKADFWIGFLTELQPPATLKNLFNKTAPALALRLKLEHQPADPSKSLLLESELVSVHRTGAGSLSETKGAKTSLTGVGALGGYIRLAMSAVRTSATGYELSYRIESWGSSGAAFQALLASGTLPVVNPSLAGSHNLRAGLVVAGQNFGAGRLDNYFARLDTHAPDAPPLLNAADITASSFRAAWDEAVLGRLQDGFFLEVARASDGLQPGSYLAADGTPGQAQGILIEDPFARDFMLQGLAPSTNYVWRVRAYNLAGSGPALSPRSTRTLNPTYQDWLAYYFTSAELADPAISGDRADPNANGLGNLLDYAFGFHPRAQAPGGQSPTQLEVGPSNRLRITFRRRVGEIGVAYLPQASSDLITWSSTGLTEISASEPDADGFQTVTVEDAADLATTPRRFLRVFVERTTP